MPPETVAGKTNKSIRVKELLAAKGRSLKLTVASGARYLDRRITVSEANRPGLALTGHLENFRAERIQIIGRGEHAFCDKDDHATLLKNLAKMLSGDTTPCLIITTGLKKLDVLKKACSAAKIPLLYTTLDTAAFVGELTAFLEEKLAYVTKVHGVLVDVYGLGVLIEGDPAVGKSECALELVKRGHILVADDIVEIERKRGNVLMGSCPSMLKHYMEVRGLGIIDVELLFGVGSIMDHSKIELQVRLMFADKQTSCDRTGIEQHAINILGVDIPSLNIPVTPGRNLAVLIEVAALNQRLKAHGIFAARDFNRKLIQRMKSGGGAQ